MQITALAVADLVLLLVATALGFTALRAWTRHHTADFPVAKVVAHVTLQVVSIGVWTAFVITGSLSLAWTAFIVITVGQVFGDLLMFASYRIRHPGVIKPSYRDVSSDALNFRRPVRALHAVIGAIAWFGMLAICIAAT